jgi:hypothetical protein
MKTARAMMTKCFMTTRNREPISQTLKLGASKLNNGYHGIEAQILRQRPSDRFCYKLDTDEANTYASFLLFGTLCWKMQWYHTKRGTAQSGPLSDYSGGCPVLTMCLALHFIIHQQFCDVGTWLPIREQRCQLHKTAQCGVCVEVNDAS